MERRLQHLQKLNELTCLALGKAAHIEDLLETIETQTLELIQDTAHLTKQY